MATVSFRPNYLCRDSNYEHFRHSSFGWVGLRLETDQERVGNERSERRRGGGADERRSEIGAMTIGSSQKLKLARPAAIKWANEADGRPLQPLCEVSLPLHRERAHECTGPYRTAGK